MGQAQELPQWKNTNS